MSIVRIRCVSLAAGFAAGEVLSMDRRAFIEFLKAHPGSFEEIPLRTRGVGNGNHNRGKSSDDDQGLDRF